MSSPNRWLRQGARRGVQQWCGSGRAVVAVDHLAQQVQDGDALSGIEAAHAQFADLPGARNHRIEQGRTAVGERDDHLAPVPRVWRELHQFTRLQALDDHLWTYSDESFLPHGTDREPDAASQPVVLTLRDVNPNTASIRFLVEGADLPPDAGQYERICILFDGTDQDALLRAREQWKQAKDAGHAVAYWQQDESGRWNKKA